MGKIRQNVHRLKKAQLMAVAVSLFLFLLLPISAYAAKTANVVGSRTVGQDIFLYIDTVSETASQPSVQIGSTVLSSTEVKTRSIAASGIPVKTVFLFDNSISLKKVWGEKGKQLMSAVIDGHAQGEAFRIATFSESVSEMSDFSTDYESLKAGIGNIEFANQDTYLTDALYDLVNNLQSTGESNFVRIIIITDGSDDNEITYTKSELTDLLKNAGIPVHTIGAKTGKNSSALEDLFSYSRQSFGRTYQVDSKSGYEDIVTDLAKDYSMMAAKLTIPESLKDGSVKAARISFNDAEGEVVAVANLTMPFADVNKTPASVEEEPEEETVVSTQPSETKELPVISTKDKGKNSKTKKNDKDDKLPIIIWAVAGALGAIVLIVVIIVIVNVLKKKKASGTHELDSLSRVDNKTTLADTTETPGNHTEIIDTGKKSGTVILFGNGAPKQGPRFTLVDTEDSSKTYSATIENKIIIGRHESSDIALSFDTSVSGTHCKVERRGGQYFLTDEGSSNGTFYGGNKVTSEIPIVDGGTLELGRCKYRIRIEE